VARTNIRALRFAEAAFAVAREAQQLDAWLDSLEQAASIYDNHAAALFLTSPVVPAGKKRAVLAELLPTVSPDVGRFLAILARRDRLELVPEIARVFRRLLNEHRGIAVAQVTTAVPIDERQKSVIASRLGRRVGKTVTVETRIDPSILGGVIAQIGDNVIDGSVRGRLERLRRALTA
jgi:F-type H+-transporting ATPase subunit delta